MLTMYDSINVAAIPKDAKAVAGYVGGHWPTYPTLLKQFPHAHVLSIAVASTQDAMCLDVEQGDATNETAKRWMKRQLSRMSGKPVLYTSISNARALIAAMDSIGVHRSQYKLWSAHYTHKPHICDKNCGFGNVQADATQYTNHALGRTLDASLCSDSFFGSTPPKPKPKATKKFEVTYVDKDGTVHTEQVDKVGAMFRFGRFMSGYFAEFHAVRQ